MDYWILQPAPLDFSTAASALALALPAPGFASWQRQQQQTGILCWHNSTGDQLPISLGLGWVGLG